MQEDKENGQRADILYQEDIQMEEATAQSTPIGELVVNYLVGQEPANEDTGQESDNRQEYLTGDEVEPVEEALTEDHHTVASTTQRQRAQHAKGGCGDRHDEGSALARDRKFLVDEGGGHLVERDERRESCQCQQYKEQQRDNPLPSLCIRQQCICVLEG